MLNTVLTGLGFGLAILAKSTAALFLFPFLALMFCRELFAKRTIVVTVARFAAIACVAVLLNLPHWARNWEQFRNPLGDKEQVNWIQSQTLAPGPLFSTIVRNMSLEFTTPWLKQNRVEEAEIRKLIKAVGQNPDDPRNTFPPVGRFTLSSDEELTDRPWIVSQRFNHEDYAPDPLQVVLLVAATLLFPFIRDLRRSEVMWFSICLWVGFVLFSWRISWMPWNVRLLSSFLALASLPIAFLLGRLYGFCRWGALAMIAGLVVVSVFPMFCNATRSWVKSKDTAGMITDERSALYFANRPELLRCYSGAVEILSQTSCNNIRLRITEDVFEYPFWVLARSKGLPINFQHERPENALSNAADGRCANIYVDSSNVYVQSFSVQMNYRIACATDLAAYSPPRMQFGARTAMQ